MFFAANCKINLGLDVIRRREDGYHDLETIMLPVEGLFDMVEIIPSESFGFTCSGLSIDSATQDNLCVKAYNIVLQEFGIDPVSMRLHKMIPFGAGLGGGSSDAAAVIKGLNTIFSLRLTIEDMERLAAMIGSDVPFFISNKAVLASGRGEIFTALDNSVLASIKGKYLVIVKPNFGIGTAEAYSGITPHAEAFPLIDRIGADISLWREKVVNAFEKHLFVKYPSLARIKEDLYQSGAVYASMSGSGSAFYAFFDSPSALNLRDENIFRYQQFAI